MSVPFSNTKLRVPRGFQNLLEGLAREVLRNQPENIYAFAAVYFDNLLKIREEQGIDPADIGAKHEDRYYNNKAFEKGNNVGDVSDPQQQAAATKIQSGVRMNQAQAKAEEIKAEKDNTEDEKEEVSKQEEDAALKIQSSYRGYEARKRVKELKEQKAESSEGKEVINEETKKPEEEIDIDLNDPEVAKAASKIQAGFRGHKTRKELKEKPKSDEKLSDEQSTEQTEDTSKVHESTDQLEPTTESKEEQTSETKETEEASEKPAKQEEEIDIDLNDPEVEKAAVKIQASFKGFKVRKEKKEKEGSSNTTIEDGEAAETEEKQEEKTEEKMDPAAATQEEEVDIDLNDPEVEKAATKIQASFKGFKARKEMKKKENGEEEPAKEETAKETVAEEPITVSDDPPQPSQDPSETTIGQAKISQKSFSSSDNITDENFQSESNVTIKEERKSQTEIPKQIESKDGIRENGPDDVIKTKDEDREMSEEGEGMVPSQEKGKKEVAKAQEQVVEPEQNVILRNKVEGEIKSDDTKEEGKAQPEEEMTKPVIVKSQESQGEIQVVTDQTSATDVAKTQDEQGNLEPQLNEAFGEEVTSTKEEQGEVTSAEIIEGEMATTKMIKSQGSTGRNPEVMKGETSVPEVAMTTGELEDTSPKELQEGKTDDTADSEVIQTQSDHDEVEKEQESKEGETTIKSDVAQVNPPVEPETNDNQLKDEATEPDAPVQKGEINEENKTNDDAKPDLVITKEVGHNQEDGENVSKDISQEKVEQEVSKSDIVSNTEGQNAQVPESNSISDVEQKGSETSEVELEGNVQSEVEVIPTVDELDKSQEDLIKKEQEESEIYKAEVSPSSEDNKDELNKSQEDLMKKEQEGHEMSKAEEPESKPTEKFSEHKLFASQENTEGDEINKPEIHITQEEENNKSTEETSNEDDVPVEVEQKNLNDQESKDKDALQQASSESSNTNEAQVQGDAPPPKADEPNKEEEEEIDIDLNDPKVADATVKIQAGFKGMMARKALKKESGSEVAADTTEDAKPNDDATTPDKKESTGDYAAEN